MNNVIQIFLSEEKEDFSQKLQNNCRNIINLYSDCNYKLFDDDKIQQFLKENYEEEILQTYKSLSPVSYKSDFARYCLLYKLGGWYFDIGLEVKEKIKINKNTSLVYFRYTKTYIQNFMGSAGGIILNE